MKKFACMGDCHLDLTTDGIDRNPEIRRVMLYAVNWAIKKHVDYFVWNGDVFDNNTPSDTAIGIFLECLSRLNEAGIKVFVVDGNHEKKHRGEPSCLHFISKIGFKNVRVIHDIKGIKISKDLRLIFFPHVNKPNIPKEFKTPQDYVEARADAFVNKMDLMKHSVLVFSHLNVKDVIPGTEEHMLKKSEVYLPDYFHTKQYLLKPDPVTINGHIHTAQKSGRVQIVGSPVFCGYGEKEDKKFFAYIEMAELGDNACHKVELIRSPCSKFHEIVFEITEPKKFDFAKEEHRFQSVGKRDYVKISVTGPESVLDIDWKKIREHVAKSCLAVKEIKPTVSRVRSKRNPKQQLNMKPHDAVSEFVKTNKPKNSKAVLRVADHYLREVL